MYDIIILGSGPAGFTAALYTARAGKKTLILGGDKLGGQTAGIASLENFPGWAGSGQEFAVFMKSQVEKFGTEVVFQIAKKISGDEDQGFAVETIGGDVYNARAVIIATGASPKKLEILGARELFGKGVSYCATCDGFFYTDKDVIVIGGGSSALNDALYLSDLAKSVKIIYRKDAFTRAEYLLAERVAARDNIESVFNTELKSIMPKSGSESGELVATTTTGIEIDCDGVFVAIGHEANTDYLSENVKRDNLGRIISESLPSGMYAAGDVKSGIKMQISTAVGAGCEAGMDAIARLNSKAKIA